MNERTIDRAGIRILLHHRLDSARSGGISLVFVSSLSLFLALMYALSCVLLFNLLLLEKSSSFSMTPSTTTDKCDIGLYGLAVMGQNFALNMAEHGFKVCVGNRSPAKVDATVERAKQEGDLPIVGAKSAEEFCSKLSVPRKIVILVQAGKPVDSTIENLSQYLEEGDIIIDGGNEWFPNQIRRNEELAKKGIMFVGMGISGGEEGARKGPSLMPGGPREAYDIIEPILMKCAAQVKGEACTGYCGPIGAGNYVKMVHNGIEYGDMQLISEVYDILKVTTCRMLVLLSILLEFDNTNLRLIPPRPDHCWRRQQEDGRDL
jgi:6-phosphogluconate dehydrogenase (decarboxylating)